MTLQESPREVRQSAERIMAAWRAGQPADAAAVLRDQPDFALHRSIVIDLVYEEYLQRERGGDAPEPAAFARGFPEFQASVQDLIEAHRVLVEQPELLSLPEEGWPELGGTIEGLELKRELGRGSFGRAYLALDPALGRLRVVKLAPGGTAEARLIGGLNHRHVIDVLWTRPIGGRTAVCMPFVGSATLATLIARAERRTPNAKLILETTAASPDEPPASRAGPVAFERDSDLVAATAIGAKLARAIAYLHDRRVVHGDIKPSNVVLQPGGSPQVIDFNLAAGEEPAFAIRGTPAYMAPELLDAALAGKRPEYDGAKADIFALGVTLIELFTGRHPYRLPGGDNLAELAVALRACEPAIPGLPAPLARMLKRSLAVSPTDRPTAVELADELDRFVSRERTRPHRRLRAVLGAVAALLVAGLIAGASLKTPRDRLPTTAEDFRNRGLAALRDGDAAAARAEFVTAHERGQNPNDLAWAAYCYSRTGGHDIAVEWYKRAIAAGADTAEVRNNRGASLWKLGNHEEALRELNLALEKDANLRTARYNRAHVRYLMAIAPKPKNEMPLAVADMDEVLKTGPYSPDLHYDAARIYLQAGMPDRTIAQLEQAVKLGYLPAKIMRDPSFKKQLGKDPRFANLAGPAAQPAPPPLQLHFVEPS